MLFERLFAHRLNLPPPDQPLDGAALPACGGVCALTDADGRLIQTLSTRSLRRSICLRLSSPGTSGARKRADLRAITRTLWWQPTYSTFEDAFVYLNVSRQLAPATYRKQLAFGPVWFACINLSTRLPRWVVSDSPFGHDLTAAGPFTTRRRCAQFIEALEDLFDLCRYTDVLDQTPHGRRCAYFDMGRCPAPCDGTIGLDVYRVMLERSVQFATSSGTMFLEELRQKMAAAAEAIRFEEAQRFKIMLERATKAVERGARLAPTPASFRWLVIQAGPGASTLRPFFVDGGTIRVGSDVHLDDLPRAAPQWVQACRSSDNAAHHDDTYRTECIWLISHFVAKSDKASGIYLSAPEMFQEELVVRRVLDRFSRSRRPRERS